MTRNSRAFRQINLRYDGFATDLDLYTESELETDPLHADLLYPHGFGWAAGTVIRAPTGDLLIYNVERRREDGPFGRAEVERLDLMRGHLARAALLTAHLAHERARAAVDALGTLGLPAAVLARRSSRLLAANALFDALVPDVVVERRGPAGWRVGLANRASDTFLDRTLKSIRNGRVEVGAGSCSLPIPAQGEAPPYIVHLVPVCRSAQDMFTNASCLMVVTPVTRDAVAPMEVVQGLFDLTPAEARAARWIAGGGTIEGLAKRLGRSPDTIRSQLKGIFAKTGVSRQVELVALLSGTAQPIARAEHLP
jgi:DNA-binding CsgD family transcriptional regulator